eukprot:3937742-Rhodomonas_salina.3
MLSYTGSNYLSAVANNMHRHTRMGLHSPLLAPGHASHAIKVEVDGRLAVDGHDDIASLFETPRVSVPDIASHIHLSLRECYLDLPALVRRVAGDHLLDCDSVLPKPRRYSETRTRKAPS